ncbi:formylglycine-generating enzyme family protein [Verrucomicrobiota bacterium]
MSRRRFSVVLVVAAALALPGVSLGISVIFDYTYDTTGFFDSPAARVALEEAGRFFTNKMSANPDDAITPAGGNQWELWLDLPQDGGWHWGPVGAGPRLSGMRFRVYVGAPDHVVGLSRVTAAGASYTCTDDIYGERWCSFWERQNSASYFRPLGGTIWFNPNENWYFDGDASSDDDIPPDQMDFFSEVFYGLHRILGLHWSERAQALIDADGKWAGPMGMLVNGGEPMSLAVRVARPGERWYAYGPSSDRVFAMLEDMGYSIVRALPGVELGGGWKYSDWFGIFWYDSYYGDQGWIYHMEHAWQYFSGYSHSGIWIWDPYMNWLWTSAGVYPYLYSVDDAAWLMYLEGSVDPRYFCNMATGAWGTDQDAIIPGDAPTGMVGVPAGSFNMGSNEGELPVHSVNVGAFYMDEHEVTKALWDEVAAWATENGYDIDASDGEGKQATHPVQSVSWYECVKWCNARSEKEGMIPAYYTSDARSVVYRAGTIDVTSEGVEWDQGYRLPTEAEWERAARGGAEFRRFPWNDSDEIQHARANYNSSGNESYDTSPTHGYHPDYDSGDQPYTSPAGSFSANSYGLYDMAGNVSEWCWDWYGDTYYGSSPGTDPHGPASGLERVTRGGAWAYYGEVCRVAARRYNSPDATASSYGFRSVLPAP